MNKEKENLSAIEELMRSASEIIESKPVASLSVKIGKCGELENIEIEIKKPKILSGTRPAEREEFFPRETTSEVDSIAAGRETETSSPEAGAQFFEVKSPLIGVVYTSPSPESEPYIKIGQRVQKGDILCIIEAMKVMNEVESEREGTVTQILFKNGEMTQFGDLLAVIDTSN